MRIGCSGIQTAGTAPFFVGDIAEIIVIHNDVTTATREIIEGYLAHKYGLVALLPPTHPYKIDPPLA
jgi:hypothetical protein